MNVLDQIITRAANRPARIVLCESGDARVLHAASRAMRDKIAFITLVGEHAGIEELARQENIDLDGIRIIDPVRSPLRAELGTTLKSIRPWARMTAEDVSRDAVQPLHFANLLVRTGHADGSVSGAIYTSPDVMRSAIRIIGRESDTTLLAAFFLMFFDQPHHPVQGGMIFADCALNIDPSAGQLADIAIMAAQNARFLLNDTPRIAMLSFSTAGSARHSSVDKVIQAARHVKERWPGLMIDQDMQLDAAIVPWINARKAPASCVQGRANVLVFPNLEAGNIGYKMAERFGGATAIGPLLHGLKRPANDLSRGCSADDIYYAIAVTSIQAHERPPAPDGY